MLRLCVSIKTPFAKDVVDTTAYEYTKQLSKHKYFEAEYYYSNYYLLLFDIDLSWRGEDHAGPQIELSLLGYSIRYKITDDRHWDYDNGKWMTKNEADKRLLKFDSFI